MGEAVEQRGGHLGVAEDRRPFAEGKVGGDDDRGLFVELADQVEQELPAGLGKGEIAEGVRLGYGAASNKKLHCGDHRGENPEQEGRRL